MQLKNWAKFWVIGLGTLLGPLDSAVNIAFPDITRSFAIPLSDIQWVIISYVLTYASLMLVFGRLGDQFGHLKIFKAGLAISAISFIACGLVRQFELLLLFRVLQGIGTAMVLSCGPALATVIFTEAERPKVLATYALALGLGSAIGPSLGGFLVGEWGWPSVFWFRLPIALLALVLSLRLRLPAQARATGSFDFFNAIIMVAALFLLLFSFNQLRNPDFGTGILIVFIVLSLVALIVFVFRELRVPTPILDLKLFANLDFSLINLSNIAVNLVGFSVFLLVPYYLSRKTGLSIAAAGLVLAMSPLGQICAARLGGRLLQPVGANRLAFVGAMMVAVAVTTIGFWPTHAALHWLFLSLILHGFGLGLFQLACLEFVVSVVPLANRGVAGSLVMVTRTMGVVFSASLLMLYFVAQVAQAEALPDAFLTGFQVSFQNAGIGLLLFIAATCLRPRLWFGSKKNV